MSKSKKDKVELNFIGKNNEAVTGSCIHGIFKDEEFLLELGGVQEGTMLKNYRANKELLDRIDFTKIKYIFLLHFHSDHSMLVIGAVSRGFTGKIITNHKTAMIAKLLWEDSCHIMEGDVKHLREREGVKAEALYKREDISETMNYIFEYDESIIHKLSESISFRLLKNNHVLGSTSLELFFKADNSKVSKLFYSSDMGTSLVNKYFVFDEVEKCVNANVAILESTYNSKVRKSISKKTRKEDLKLLEDTIIDTLVNKGGTVVLPAFSADRTQNILVHIKNIFDRRDELKNYEVIVDGRLTSKVTKQYSELLEGEQKILFDEIMRWENLRIISDFNKETKVVLGDKTPKIIISSSGFAEKGHILEYIKKTVRKSEDTIIFTGYSSPTSLASRLKEKIIDPTKKNISIEKINHPFNCSVVELSTFSSHIQRQELINLMKEMNITDKIILVHGEKTGRIELAEETMEEIKKINKTTKVMSCEKNMRIEF